MWVACAALLFSPVSFFNDTATTEIYTLSLHDALPILLGVPATSTLAGNVSVKLIPDCAGLPAPLVNVKGWEEGRAGKEGRGGRALLNEKKNRVGVWVVMPFVSTPPTVTLTEPLV